MQLTPQQAAAIKEVETGSGSIGQQKEVLLFVHLTSLLQKKSSLRSINKISTKM
jgi:hypothetical protein